MNTPIRRYGKGCGDFIHSLIIKHRRAIEEETVTLGFNTQLQETLGDGTIVQPTKVGRTTHDSKSWKLFKGMGHRVGVIILAWLHE